MKIILFNPSLVLKTHGALNAFGKKNVLLNLMVIQTFLKILHYLDVIIDTKIEQI